MDRKENITTTEEMESQIQALAENARSYFGLSDEDKVTLINVSENMTYRIDRAGGEKLILRWERDGWQSQETMMSEVSWMTALQADRCIQTRQASPSGDGNVRGEFWAPKSGTRDVGLMGVSGVGMPGGAEGVR